MTDKELKKLQDKLWGAADILRSGAHLAANKFGQPILGLIFLRYADILYKQHKEEIENEYNSLKGTRREKTIEDIAIEKCGFYLPEEASYTKINDAPDTAEKATLVKKAMDAIEKYNKQMDGVLPKEVYGQLVPEEEPDLLSRIMRIFMDIPEDIGIDLFGQIYEYFLGNFALEEGKGGGAFYTPATVVRYMVEVLKPEYGNKKFLDPACGSGGMFVQAARYMHKHNKQAATDDVMQFVCNGVEKEPDTVKLAKMNLLLNNVRGEIKEANSFYSDPYNAYENYDYVMANPPFNVDEVVYERIKDDKRFNKYGLPKNKSKSGKKDDKKETVPNANYLWISYFYAYLNEKGRAGFVMASSATDSQHADKEIRSKLVNTGHVDVILSVGNNFFYTLSLPCTLWFFDKGKKEDLQDKVLFIDARNYYTVVDRNLNEWSKWQMKNLTAIVHLYRGEKEKYTKVISDYCKYFHDVSDEFNGREMAFALANCNGVEDFTSVKNAIEKEIANIQSEQKQQEQAFDKKTDEAINADDKKTANEAKRQKKVAVQVLEGLLNDVKEVLTVANEALWLTEKFSDGVYVDVAGLCRIAKRCEIAEKNYSLTPGAYVGVADIQEEDENFEERMKEIHAELNILQNESNSLMEQINANLKEIGLGD